MRNRLVVLSEAAAGQGTNLADMDTSAAIFPQPVAGEDLSIGNVTNSTALLTQPASGYLTSLPTMDASPAILSQPALGQDVQLGMLYDSRTAQFFGGVSLWDNEIVNARQTLEEHTLQNGEFTYSTSLEEARNQAALDVEGALGLDLGMFKAAGSAKYLNDNKTSAFEARVDVSCTIVRRTRRIPQEILASMQHERKLDDPQFTHFVGEVVEGGSATLSFVQSCSSAENAKKVLGRLKAKVMLLSAAGEVNLDQSKDNDSIFEGIKISYSGAMAENVTNIEDARRVARKMPTKLMKQLNTLTYKLLPLKVLDNTVNRNIRQLDATLVNQTAAALKAGTIGRFQLKDLAEQVVFQKWFPAIRQQILNIQTVFADAETQFTQTARRLLPELRDGSIDYKVKISELQEAVALYEQRSRIVEQFVAKKLTEAYALQATVASLLADGFENHLGGIKAQSLADTISPRLLLSFGGASINRSRHPLQMSIESSTVGANADDKSDSDSDDDDPNDEWFENPQTVANVREACSALRLQRSHALPTIIFGVAGVDKAYRPGSTKRTKTSVGDIVLDSKGKLFIVTGMLPKAPRAPKLKVEGQSIIVAWDHDRSNEEELAISTTGFVLRFCPRPNLSKDGAFPCVSENEASMEIRCEASKTTVKLERSPDGAVLHDDCDYEIELCVETIVGRSDWSSPIIGRTCKLPSIASRMIDFYLHNRSLLSRSTRDVTPWELDESGGKKSLFLGLVTQAQRVCTDSRFDRQLAVKIVDVAPSFEPGIHAASAQDDKNTIVVLFAGCSGHGKSTQINAFVSYLLGGAVDDFARIMMIDDRGANQVSSVTQYVTCYRIRPLSPLFEGKTLLIVDTPGYGDSRGFERDAFVTAAMSEFFKTIQHINAIIFTCRANELRTTFLSPVSTYIFSLFAKDVKACLRTIYTFSDAGAPLARKALSELKWPVENGEVEVNNAAFTVELDNQNADKVRGWWLMSIKGQFQLMKMLLSRPPVPTAGSASVTKDRIDLERKCELVEKKILRTANDAQILIANLGALANAVGAGPGDKVLVKEDRAVSKPLPVGQATTLCIRCNTTCHDYCAIGDDNAKNGCIAMGPGGKCTVCKGSCVWSEHRNARFLVVVEKHEEWVVPETLITKWNSGNNTLEGALIGAISVYLKLQEELRNDILYLADLTAKLKDMALLHDPTALIKYIETLIQTARQLGAPPAQLIQLTTAKKTLLLVLKVKEMGVEATSDSQTLLQILNMVEAEMQRRMRLTPLMRAAEEEKACSLYNELYEKLPSKIQKRAPGRLKTAGMFATGAKYPENLQAVIKLIQVVLKDGGVVSAITTSA